MKSLFAVLVLLASALSTTPASAAGAGVDPGPGWFLVMTRAGDTRTLVLVEPDGTRHPVYSEEGTDSQLLDWSPDGTTALLWVQSPEREALLVDVPSGAITRIDLPVRASVELLDPNGDGVLVELNQRIARLSRDGTWTRFHQQKNGRLVPSIDGTTLITVGINERHPVLRVLDAESGELVRRVPAPCYGSISRWWDAHRLLLSCDSSFDLLDPVTGAHRRLARLHRADADPWDDVWKAGTGLYVNLYDSCESPGHLDRNCPYIARLRPDGRMTRVDIATHGLHGVDLLGAAGSSLLIWRPWRHGRNPIPESVSWFDPATRRDRPLLTASDGEHFDYVLRYGERHPTMF